MRFVLKALFTLSLLLWANSIAAAQPPLAILMPGGSGAAKPTDFLVRNRARFEHAGFQTVVISTPGPAVQAAKAAHAKGQKVFLVGISLGVSRAAAALQAGAPADAAVFFSGAYTNARSAMPSPGKLPPTLMVHHRMDQCPVTTPASAEAFKQWSGGRVSRIVWISSTGSTMHWACGPKAAHGYFEKDNEPISAAIGFLKAR